MNAGSTEGKLKKRENKI